jgi:hypothetical protein
MGPEAEDERVISKGKENQPHSMSRRMLMLVIAMKVKKLKSSLR